MSHWSKKEPWARQGSPEETTAADPPRSQASFGREQPVDSSESSSVLRSTSWPQPPAREEHLASGLCYEVPVSRGHCSRTWRSSRVRSAGPALLPSAGPEPGTGGRQPPAQQHFSLFTRQATRRACSLPSRALCQLHVQRGTKGPAAD